MPPSRLLRLEILELRTTPVDLRIVNYNIASSGGAIRPGLVGDLSNASTADDHGILDTIGLQTTAGLARPADVILLQETDLGLAAVQTVASQLNAYYGGSFYAAGSKAGTSTGAGTQGIVYRTTTIALTTEVAFGSTSTTGAARQDLKYTIRPVGTTTDITIYNAHLKADTGSTNYNRRLSEVQAIRADADALAATANILYAGDFNFYSNSSTTEPSYAAFLAAGAGQASDVQTSPVAGSPITSWVHASNSWKAIYTQSPSSAPPAGFTGGGLDDRFDFILPSTELNDGIGAEYRAGSYHTFGNNGTTALNGSVNTAGNTSLSNTPLSAADQLTVLTDLTTVTDHLPVVADFNIPTPGVVQFSATVVSVSEAAGLATITVSRTGGSDGSVAVNYAATAGTATANQDFTPVSGTLNFAAGQTSATFTVPITNDAINEAAETIQLSLTAPTGGATLGTPATATLTIVDNDTLAVANVAVNGGDIQRSRVTSIAVPFNASVALAANAFTLTRPAYDPTSPLAATLVSGTPAAGQGKILVSTSLVGGVTVATLTFGSNSGATNTSADGVDFGSLSDGTWVLTVRGAAVAGPVGSLAADFSTPNAGTAGQGRIFRLFGDDDGDGDVDLTNLSSFRGSFTLTNGDPGFLAAFDFDGDGDVDLSDLSQFRQRFALLV